MNSKKKVEEILRLADITVNGNRAWDVVVRNDNFYNRILGGGSLAIGEAYMDGWWYAPALDQFFYKIFRADLWEYAVTPSTIIHAFIARVFNFQNKLRSSRVAKKHY